MSQNVTERQLWHPQAERLELQAQGPYKHKYPEGAVVHFTAGSSVEGAVNTAKLGKYAYFIIDRAGKIYQGTPLDQWGYHAGPSYHPNVGQGVSDSLVGIELVAAGIVEKVKAGMFKAWFQRGAMEHLPKEEVRVISQAIDNVRPGAYHKYTRAQEDALVELLLWLKTNNKTIFRLENVLGHDEVCVPQGRKVDPGGALSMTMPQFRTFLKKEFENRETKT